MEKMFKPIAILITTPIIVIGLLVLFYILFLFVAHDFNTDFLKIDSCLDQGGRWNYEGKTCEK